MKPLVALALLTALVSGCGGPDTDLHRNSLFPSDRLTNVAFAPAPQATCTPDAAPTGVSHTMNLWPPNHTLHTITADQCATISDDCDSDLSAELIWASSDEPENSIGDGNHLPDISAGCDGVRLRSERQGPRNGRVYHIGWRATDSAGNVAEGACTVIVDHDQSAAVTEDDGESYRVEFDFDACAPEEPVPPECPDPDNVNCF